MQQLFGLSDRAMEEALRGVPPHGEFASLDAGTTQLREEITIPRLRHLLLLDLETGSPSYCRWRAAFHPKVKTTSAY